MAEPTRAAVGHMPFKGHRTCAEWGPTPIDKFMDHLAEHGDVARAAAAVGKSRQWGETIVRAWGAAA